MSYDPTLWKTGDVITAEKLNKIENAIGTIYLVSQQVADDREALMFNSETPVNYQTIIEGINAGRQFNLIVGSAESFDVLPLSRCYQEESQTDGGTEYHVVFTNGALVLNCSSQNLTEGLAYSLEVKPLPYTPTPPSDAEQA